MAEIVNLRQARKRKLREDKNRLADANRMAHGRTKTERKLAESERLLADRHHDGHRRIIEKPDP